MKTRWQIVLGPLAAGLVTIGICAGLYSREASQVEQNLQDREAARVALFARLCGRDLRSVITDLRLLADGDGLRAYLESGQPAGLERAARRALFFSRHEADFDQIRYLDERGQEVLRVNQGTGVVPPELLQNKADRPYFQKTSQLGPGAIYVSSFDLNQENGRVEQPFKPMLRFATPVFDPGGRRRGIYIINYSGANLVARLQQMVPQWQHRLRLLNAQGYWLKGAEPAEEWGFMFPERAGATLARTDPVLWNHVVHERGGQSRGVRGLLTWQRFAPHDGALERSEAVAEDAFLVLASEVSPQEWASALGGLRQRYAIVGALLLVLLLASFWFLHARRRAQRDLDRFFNLPLDFLCVFCPDGSLRRASPAVAGMLGWTPPEVLARPFAELIHPEDRGPMFRAMENRAAVENEVLEFENRCQHRNGTWRVLSWRAAPQPGGLTYATARDVTENKRAEAALREAKDELERRVAQRTAELAQSNEEVRALNATLERRVRERTAQLEAANRELESFSYSVSHDLRAPLRHIDGFVDMLAKDAAGTLSEKSKRFLKVISESAGQMGQLIDDLLEFSRMGRAEMQRAAVDLDLLTHELIESWQTETLARGVVWKVGPLPIVEGDPPMLKQVFVNLLSNAVKYSRRRDPAEIEIGSNDASEDEIVLFVRDNGAGFDMKYAHKLFGVFQRLHRAEEFEGTGVGLANVRRIISRHGGRVWAESAVDAGATFYLALPKSLPNEDYAQP